jgi:hypothetical protein
MTPDTQKLTALKEELKKDLEALERVERLIAFKNGSLSAPTEDRQLHLGIATVKPVRGIDDADEDAEGTPTISLKAKIAEIINHDHAAKWTTQRMLNHLVEIHFPLKAKKPVYSIGQSLNSLVTAGKIRLVRKGSGSEPNIYKGKLPVGQVTELEGPSGNQGGTMENGPIIAE